MGSESESLLETGSVAVLVLSRLGQSEMYSKVDQISVQGTCEHREGRFAAMS